MTSQAQPDPDGPPPPVPGGYAPDYPPPPNPLDELMGPVALYPDPIISILLPASTFPDDIASAASYMRNGGDPGQVDGQPWDQSVRALAHYPDVVTWMAQNPQWTQSLGASFAAQPAEVMEAIQRLRELARAAGTLTSNHHQQVIVEGSYIEIEPVRPNVIYIPRYDTQVVYVDQPYQDYNGPFFTYSEAFQAGTWLTYGCDWGGRSVVVVDSGYWRDESGWRHNPYGVRISINVNARPRPWGFPNGRPRPQAPSNWRQSQQVINARPISGAPPRPPQSSARDIHTHGAGAVTVVGRNPAAFKGQRLNTTIINRGGPATSPQHMAPSSRTQNGSVGSAPHTPPPFQNQRQEPGRAIPAPGPTVPARHDVNGPPLSPAQRPPVTTPVPNHVENRPPGAEDHRVDRPTPHSDPARLPASTPAPTRSEIRVPTAQPQRVERPAPQGTPPRGPATTERNENVRPNPSQSNSQDGKSVHTEPNKDPKPAREKAPPQRDPKDDPQH